MFPTATSTIYRNEDGEVTGWDSTYYDDEPVGLDPWDDYDNGWSDEHGYRECLDEGCHGDDATYDKRLDTWVCDHCQEPVSAEQDAWMRED